MTDTGTYTYPEVTDADRVKSALERIDGFLTDTTHQSLIDTERVHDFLLDLRLDLSGNPN